MATTTASSTRPARRLPPPRHFAYRPGLDGVRAFAVVAVLLYHVDIAWIPGGFLGVETFFVLSGYLITALLLAEMAEDGEVSLTRFWVRRARRLLPAAYALMAGVVALAVMLRSELARVVGELPAAIFYVYNWLPVLTEQSYFEFMGRPSPFQHLWSLAIEEQFYLVWPVVVIGALRWGGRRRLGWVALTGIVASSLAMVALADPGMDPSRVYYGTDTRAAGLLFGALGAIIWHPSRPIGRRHRLTLTVGGVLGAAGLVTAFWRVSEFGSFLYRGGFPLIALASLLVTLAAADAGGPLGRLLGVSPLRWLGTRSYAVYLWHWPVVVFTRPGIDIPFDGLSVVGLRITASLLLAEISHRLIETRFRWSRTERRRVRVRAPYLRPVGIPRRALAALTSLLLLVSLSAVGWEGPIADGNAKVLAAGLFPTPEDPGAQATEAVESVTTAHRPPSTTTVPSLPTSEPDPAPSLRQASGQKKVQEQKGPETTKPQKATRTVAAPSNALVLAEVAEREGTPAPFTPPTTRPPPPPPPSVTAIGDSVMAGAVAQLEKAYNGPIDVDAEVGRSFAAGIATAEQKLEEGSLGDVVVVHLGNNGIFESEQVKKLVDVVGPDRRLLFLTVRVPRRWQDLVNRTLTETLPKIDNARLVDWFAVSEGKRKWFNADGLHIVDTPGAPAYAKLITTAVGKLGKS